MNTYPMTSGSRKRSIRVVPRVVLVPTGIEVFLFSGIWIEGLGIRISFKRGLNKVNQGGTAG